MTFSKPLRQYRICEIIRSEALYRGEVVANYRIEPIPFASYILTDTSPENAFLRAQTFYPELRHRLAVEEVRG